jgi:hypothetical protein
MEPLLGLTEGIEAETNWKADATSGEANQPV